MDNMPPFICEFIRIYRSYPCLWRVKDESYANKKAKDEAYGALVEFYRKAVPSATKETVKKKINNLRSSFRKELKKVRNQNEDDPHKPTLWYYDLLLFVVNQDAATPSVEGEYFNEFMDDQDQDETSFQSPHSPEESPIQSFPYMASAWSEAVAPVQPPEFINAEIPTTNERKRKKTLDTALRALREDDEFDGIGLNVACKLRRMGDEQSLYAEMLINKVLLYGLSGRLHEGTDLFKLKFA